MIPDPFEPPTPRPRPEPPLFSSLVSWALSDQLDGAGLAVVTMVVRQRRETEPLILTLRFRPDRFRLTLMEAKLTTSILLTSFDVDPRHIPTTIFDIAIGVVRQHSDRLLAEQRGRA